jgi:hypothetical protein
MKTRKATKLFFLFVLCMMVSIGSQCGGGANSGCNYHYCCVYGFRGTPFVAIYNDGFRYRGTIGINDVGTYPLRGQPCWSIAVLTGSNFGFSLSANPSGADLNNPPSSVTISGGNGYMSGAYGMPMVEYFDGNGYYVGSVTATSVSGDGTWLTAPVPDLSSVYSGTYQVRVTNRRSDGEYLDIIGSAYLSCWGRDRPDSDGDGWYDDEDCHPWDPTRWSCYDPCGPQYRGAGSADRPIEEQPCIYRY